MTRQTLLLILLYALGTVQSPGATPPDVSPDPGQPSALIAGQAAMEDGLYALAQEQLQAYLDAQPENGPLAPVYKATLLLLESLYRQAMYDDLLQRSESLLARWPSEAPRDALLYWSAMARHKLEDHAGALEQSGRLLSTYPTSPYGGRVLRLRGWCFLAMHDRKNAIEMFDAFAAAHADSPQSTDNLLDLGKTLLAAGHTNRAAEVLGALVDQSPPSPVTLEGTFWLAQDFMLERRWQEAVDLLQPLVDRSDIREDLRGRAWLVLAEANQQRGNIDAAISAFQRGIETVRDETLKRRAGLNLGRLLLAEGEIDRGVELLKGLITDAPTDPEADAMQLALAEALLEDNRPEEAVAEFQHYLESFTNQTGLAQAYRGKGWGLLALDHNTEAATAFLKAAELFPPGPDRDRCIFKAGDAYFTDGDFKNAQAIYNRFLETFTDSGLVPNALFQLGESWALGGDAERANALFQQVIDRFPDQPLAEEALLRMAQLQADQQRLVAAIDGFDDLMARYTNSTFYAEALHGRGMARYRLFRFRDALKDFERVRATYPDSPTAEQALYHCALCHYGLGEDTQALKACQDFLEWYPDSPWVPQVMFWLGKYHFNHQQFEEAEQRLVAFADRYPAHDLADDALLWAGVAASERKEYVRAVEVLNRLVKDYPKSDILPEARFTQADALSHLAKCSAAILIFDEIINKYPDHELVPAAWGRKGDNQFTLGAEDPERYKESITSYRMIVNNSSADHDLVMQAEYKIGRSLEKLGRTDEAFEQYYLNVIVRYMDERKKGIWHNESAKFWFRRAAFDAADLMAARNDWRRVVTILKRVVESGVPGKELAQERIDTIRSEKWWLFY